MQGQDEIPINKLSNTLEIRTMYHSCHLVVDDVRKHQDLCDRHTSLLLRQLV